MKIKVIAIGKMKKLSPFYTLIEEYKKRLNWKIEIIEHDEKSYSSVDIQKNKESKLLLASVKGSTFKIALDEHGKVISSVEFSQKIENWQNVGVSDISFFIGGANGHSQELLNSCDYKLSLGKMTLPHLMARVILVEQIYRANSILNNHPYHKV